MFLRIWKEQPVTIHGPLFLNLFSKCSKRRKLLRLQQLIVLAKHSYMYIKKSIIKGPNKKKNRKIYTYTSDKKDTFLLYIPFADFDHDVCDNQHKNCYKMIYNMSILEKADFLSFGACVIMNKGL